MNTSNHGTARHGIGVYTFVNRPDIINWIVISDIYPVVTTFVTTG